MSRPSTRTWASWSREAIRGLGIEVRTEASRRRAWRPTDGRVRAVVTADGPLPADIVVLGLGVRPNTALAAARRHCRSASTGGLRTDLRMRVVGPDADGLWAAGDCVETLHRVSGQPVHVPLGTHANKQGRVAGINIGGGYATFPGVIGTAVTKVCDLEVARTGLTEKEAAGAGFAFVTATVESTSRAGYYPGAPPMTVKLIAERRTGLLLGAQIVGREEAAKRIDALAVAVWNRMTVEEMTGARSQLRAAVRPGLGSGADRGPQGHRGGARRVVPEATVDFGRYCVQPITDASSELPTVAGRSLIRYRCESCTR